ncbi:MAG: acyl-CoA dehydrogenase family protein [Phycisphaeraceae bacterium]|nr:acyl-CoA dehydrogenase family protein [Phycisphaeraceae bacterium]MCB9848061.1 acyl-CoA dehydrogenase family protein [Phycisphaeraceae bacterium]
MAELKQDLKNLKGISEKDRKLIEDAEVMLGPDPEEMGLVKNMFWGNLREELVFPYPQVSAEEIARCDQLLAELEDYLRNEHPATRIDEEQEIPDWCLKRLFDIGVMGMTIPREFGGLGLGVTSYNRVLEMLGKYCASTSVVVSAHQSIGCKAIMLFGTEDQKRTWLPALAKDTLSAFCLSEPNVGCDAGGQETTCRVSDDGSHYILSGEKKWATSGALSGVFTVMARQTITDPRSGKKSERITALICTPDMPGIDIFQKNRSKCGIRGTWQARIRFTDVKVPRENLLHKEGKGLNVALSCLNYGRCTLSAGVVGAARGSMDQAIKWVSTRHQFQRPLSDFELVRLHIARMSALCYAMDAMLYMTTGMLDRHDDDIMLETALCKVFCSEMGWQVVDDALQIMGGESYMTEHGVERAFRDSRIYRIVEGSNQVMQPFVFAYGGKQLAEQMLGIQAVLGVDGDTPFGTMLARMLTNGLKPSIAGKALPLAMELFLGVKPRKPQVTRLHGSLTTWADELARCTRELSHAFKWASKEYEEKILDRQAVQARISDIAMHCFGIACTLSKLDSQLRAGHDGVEFDRDRAAAEHYCDIAVHRIDTLLLELRRNTDKTMLDCADKALAYNATLPNDRFSIPEKSPTAAGTGRTPSQDGIRQFPGDNAQARTNA